MKLVIVESPTKARTLGRFLGPEYQIMASMGHIRDLPKKKLGVDLDHDFEPEYVVSPDKKTTLEGLKAAAKNAESIILATDPDREGEAIAFHVNHFLKSRSKNILRIVFHEITKSAIEGALENPGKINLSLVFAQQARRVLDRLVGYKLSPLLWFKVRRGLSAGRVQSPAVRLIVEREREIKAFVPKEYWKIDVDLAKRIATKPTFTAGLYKIEDKKAEVGNKDQADKIVSDLKTVNYKVYDVVKEEVRKYPLPPFITSTLQRAASSYFRWTAKKTMTEAQHLYENGLITYHRTDSVNLAKEAVSRARDYIKKRYGDKYLPVTPRLYKVKSKLAQEAHEAIRVTNLDTEAKTVEERFGGDAAKLYRLIFNRFLACQMAEQVLEKETVLVSAGRYLLQAIGQHELFKGWKIAYGVEEAEKTLPELFKDEDLDLIKVNPEQKFTQPPARFTEGTLIKALEERGIGRPSTYASIISTIQLRQYTEKQEGLFQPTPVGETVNDFLVKYFANIVDYGFTAKMEDNLDAIAQGKEEWVPVIRGFYEPFSKKLDEVKKTAQRIKIAAESTGQKCPKCGVGEQVIRVGRFGKFLSCSRFPECDWKAIYVEKLGNVKCPECGSDVVIRKTRRGKKFYGCQNYPNCKWASWHKPK